jgi:hypothetical protein
VARDWRYGRSLCARSQQDHARDQSSAEIQEIPKFHDLSPFHEVRERRHAVSPPQDECSLNLLLVSSGDPKKWFKRPHQKDARASAPSVTVDENFENQSG